MSYFVVAAFYILGVFLWSCYRIFQISSEFPDESSQVKLFHTFWGREWKSFLLSFSLGLIFVGSFPEWQNSRIAGHPIMDFLRIFCAAIGGVSQIVAISFLGVSKTLVSNISKKTEAILAVNAAVTTGDPQAVINKLAAESPKPQVVADLVQKNAAETPVMPEVTTSTPEVK